MPSLLSSSDEILSSRPVRVMFDALHAGRLSHSLIISGEEIEPIAKTAEALAAEILKTPVEQLERHPDLFTIRPTGKMRQISAGNIRSLIRSIHQSSHGGGAKVALLYDADRFNQSAANIFLKTLEEPPSDTTLLLLTTRPHFLLPTIRSRCLNFRLPPAKQEDLLPKPVLDWLNAYSTWLDQISHGMGSKQAISRQIISASALSAQLAPLLKESVASEWKTVEKTLPEDLTDEEKEAVAESIRISLRDRIFTELEHRLREFARPLLTDPEAVRAFTASITALEKMAGLLQVNLREDAALEGFLLSALRHWGRRKRSATLLNRNSPNLSERLIGGDPGTG